MDAFNEFIFTPVFGVPLIIWLVLVGVRVFVYYLPTWYWGFWFEEFIWNPDYMKEVLGEELYNKLS